MSESIGFPENALAVGLVVIGGGLVVNCLLDKKADEATHVLGEPSSGDVSPDIGDAAGFDTGYGPALDEAGVASADAGVNGMATVDGGVPEWTQDPQWMVAQNELGSVLSHVNAHFQALSLELDSLREGEPLPVWVKSASCDADFVTLESIGAAPEVDAQSGEMPVDDRWKFKYGDPSPLGMGGTYYSLEYYPPSASELNADLNATLSPLGSQATTDGVPCDAGEEGVNFNITMKSRDGSNEYPAAGDFCAPGPEEVVEQTEIPEVERQARDLCNRAKEIRD